jgi:hypothetical protein
MSRPNEFSEPTKQQALARQRFLCGSCGTRISRPGDAGKEQHRFGEGARAHHMQFIRPPFLGSASVDNCIILCQSCHYSVHEGGNYGFGTVAGSERDYTHFRGQCRDRTCLCWKK